MACNIEVVYDDLILRVEICGNDDPPSQEPDHIATFELRGTIISEQYRFTMSVGIVMRSKPMKQDAANSVDALFLWPSSLKEKIIDLLVPQSIYNPKYVDSKAAHEVERLRLHAPLGKPFALGVVCFNPSNL